jgi:4-diphosphocytidyl-2-C-methyl-D-erythritol kinase
LTKSTKHTIKKKFISDFKCLTSLLINDLEHVVIPQHPEIKRLKERLLESGASGSLMSGSGSSVFGIFPNEVRAQQALSALTVTEQQRAFLVRSL